MTAARNRKSLLFILSIASLVILFTFLISIFASGYRLDHGNGVFRLRATGILSATSKPKSANVYLNDILETNTNNTLNLDPGTYHLKIVKDGYFPWEKNIQIYPELVYQSDAELFLKDPTALFFSETSIHHPTLAPNGNKIVFAVATTSAEFQEPGLYLLEFTDIPLLTSRISHKLIASDRPGLMWSKYNFEFSPDSKSIIATTPKGPSFLIDLDKKISTSNLADISFRLPTIKNNWLQDKKRFTFSLLERLPSGLASFIATNSTLAYNSFGDKVLYTASASGQLPPLLASPPPNRSTQTQDRNLQPGFFYVYDLKEDTNFNLGSTQTQFLSWIPYTNHLNYIADNNLYIVEYDTTNQHLIHSFPKNTPPFLAVTPDGQKLFTLEASSESTPAAFLSLTVRDR